MRHRAAHRLGSHVVERDGLLHHLLLPARDRNRSRTRVLALLERVECKAAPVAGEGVAEGRAPRIGESEHLDQALVLGTLEQLVDHDRWELHDLAQRIAGAVARHVHGLEEEIEQELGLEARVLERVHLGGCLLQDGDERLGRDQLQRQQALDEIAPSRLLMLASLLELARSEQLLLHQELSERHSVSQVGFDRSASSFAPRSTR